MKSIETLYKGYKFRSRLEARWAVFFDEIGADWEYEPEGFDCDGVWYLPDFVIHDGACKSSDSYIKDLYIEIKGCLSDKDRNKIGSFVSNLASEYEEDEKDEEDRELGVPFFVLGRIPEGEGFFDFLDFIDKHYDWERDIFFSFYFMWDVCRALPAKGKDGRFYMSGEYYYEYIDEEATVKAYKKALQARFEHGALN